MWTSVPQTPALRTRISTSSSRIVGTGTSFSTNPADGDSLTSARTGLTHELGDRCRYSLHRELSEERRFLVVSRAFGSAETSPPLPLDERGSGNPLGALPQLITLRTPDTAPSVLPAAPAFLAVAALGVVIWATVPFLGH